MARRIVVVAASQSMRRALAGMISGRLHDCLVIEAVDEEEGARLAAGPPPCHLVVYNWDLDDPDSAADAWRRFTGGGIPALILGPEPGSPPFQDLLDRGVSQESLVALAPEAVAAAINRLCNPVAMRRAKRYTLPGTIARIRQGETTFFGVVIDISIGGMLCDVEYAPAFTWDRESDMDIDLPAADGTVTATGIRGRVQRLAVIETGDDGEPVILRLAIRFTAVPPQVPGLFEAAVAAARAQGMIQRD